MDRLCFEDEDNEMENEWKECEKREEGSEEGEERRKYEERLEVEKLKVRGIERMKEDG